MSNLVDLNPYGVYNDLQGRPLNNGKVYIGLPNQDPRQYPAQVFWDAALTIPASQPLRTVGGYVARNGKPAKLYINGNYSLMVMTQLNVQVFYEPDYYLIGSAQPVTKQELSATNGSSLINFTQNSTDSVAISVQDKLRQWVSVKEFGVIGDGSDEYAKINKAWLFCMANNKDLFFPAGIYSSGTNNMPFKNPSFPSSTLFDGKNITIFGEGPNTILRSDSSLGADVINLYSIKNVHFRNFKITANLSGTTGAGSNGISIVGGFDNLTFDYIWMENLPYVDKGTYLDGGKAFTIQPGTPTTECGTVKANNIFANGCVYGAGLEVDLANWATKKHAIDINIIAENCYQGVIFSAGSASSPLSVGMTSGYNVIAKLINCQRNILASRAHGINIEANIITTKSQAQKRLNPSGAAWSSSDSVVDGLFISYAKNSIISAYGDLGGCNYKAQIGGASAGSSGQGANSDNCKIYIDLGGSSSVADINSIDSGGNTITNSVIYMSTTTTAGSFPLAYYVPANNNTLIKGASQKIISPTIQGSINFSYTDGFNSYNSLSKDSSFFGMFFGQTGASSADNLNFGVKNHLGNKVFSIRNDGSVATLSRATASSVATVKGVMPIYDQDNVFYGYVPIYATYS